MQTLNVFYWIQCILNLYFLLDRYAFNLFIFRIEQETLRHSRYMIWQIFI